jgi:hypothetical protein
MGADPYPVRSGHQNRARITGTRRREDHPGRYEERVELKLAVHVNHRDRLIWLQAFLISACRKIRKQLVALRLETTEG